MTTRRAARVAAVVLALSAGAAVAAVLPPEWRNWAWWCAIDTPSEGLVQIELPLDVVGHARPALEDLRVIDEAGAEVPWISYRRPARAAIEWREVPLLDTGFVPGRYSQAVLDLGEDGAPHNRVRVSIDREEFFAWVELAASDDRETWRVVRERAPLLRLGAGRAEERVLEFPETRSRWLRLRVLDDAERSVPRRCEAAYDVELPPDRAMWDRRARLVEDASEAAGETVYEFDFDLPEVPVSVARFSTADTSFHRPVTLEVWNEHEERWLSLAHGEIYRYETPVGDTDRRVAERLEIEGPEGRGRRFRVRVDDGNDRPIDDLSIVLGAERRRIGFQARPGHSYRLLFGNAQAEAPRYDLAVTTPASNVPAAPVASLGPALRNEGFVSGEPWTERHRWVLWAALVVAVVVLGLVAIRALRG